MSKRFDLVVVGTGAAGAGVARECRAAGWHVAIVDSQPFGGTCALRGCDPKKVLVGAAEAVDFARRLDGAGVRSSELGVDWPALARRKRSFVESVPESVEKRFTGAGIEVFHGRAEFVGQRALRVGSETLEARLIHIAAGSKPSDLRMAGQELVATSDRFLNLERLPRRVLFLGSGYIAFEFAHLARLAGAHVTMLEMLERPLAGFDSDVVDVLVDKTRSMGIETHFGTRVERVDRRGDAYTVQASISNGLRSFDADLVVHGAGRVPDIDDLRLDRGGVERDRRGIRVNQYLQSVSNPAVYAAGDAAASGPNLTPVAGYEGRVVTENLLHENRRKVDHGPVPSVVFTEPPLASVGLTEKEATERGLRFRRKFERTATWYSSRRVAEDFSAYKTLVDERTDTILGAHLLGPHVDEVVNVFALAMRAGTRASELKNAIWAYPTVGSDIQYFL